MPCKPNHYTTSEFLKIFASRTKQREGTQITVLKILSPFTGDFEYLTYKGDERKTHDKKGQTFLFEVKSGEWKLIEGKNNEDEERETVLNKIERIFHGYLSEKDKKLIVEQCENQGAISEEQIYNFAKAYAYSKLDVEPDKHDGSLVIDSFSKKDFIKIIKHLAKIIEKRNAKGYRKTPVTFADTSTALEPQQIGRAMQNFAEVYVENRLTPDEVYEEFERIHPFEDGNGRVGDLLWKMAVARNTGEWPQTLPPDIFSESVLQRHKRKKEEPQFLSMAQKRRYEMNKKIVKNL